MRIKKKSAAAAQKVCMVEGTNEQERENRSITNCNLLWRLDFYFTKKYWNDDMGTVLMRTSMFIQRRGVKLGFGVIYREQQFIRWALHDSLKEVREEKTLFAIYLLAFMPLCTVLLAASHTNMRKRFLSCRWLMSFLIFKLAMILKRERANS